MLINTRKHKKSRPKAAFLQAEAITSLHLWQRWQLESLRQLRLQRQQQPQNLLNQRRHRQQQKRQRLVL
ncbi:MAG: hypothetical protein JJD98_19075 [Polaromonas sp.]|nr:hypothetical protein [Polaromonas sp.]